MIVTKTIKIKCDDCNYVEVEECTLIFGMLDYPIECGNCHSSHLINNNMATTIQDFFSRHST